MKPITIERALKLATPQQLASALASRTSEKKAKSSAENGKKGGRPIGSKKKLAGLAE